MKNKITVSLNGYMKDRPKTARTTVKGSFFSIVNAETGTIAYTGELSLPVTDRDSGDKVRVADFTGFDECGKFYIKVGFRRSLTFTISEEPYAVLRSLSADTVYASRCGCELSLPEPPEELLSFMHGACHTNSVFHEGRSHDMRGGWHTRGSYEKNVPEAAIITAQILFAIKLFPESFTHEERKRFLDEAKWGLDFMMRMQDRDGGVFEDVHSYRTPIVFATRPEEDQDKQLLGEKTCLATLRFTAVSALAYTVFDKYDKLYAHSLSSEVQKGWIYICSCPEYKQYTTRLGDVAEDGSPSPLEAEFMWCLTQMYDMTGQQEFYDLISSKHITSQFADFPDGSAGGFAALCALLSERKYDSYIVAMIKRRLTDHADRLCIAADSNAYGCTCSANGGYSHGTAFRVTANVQSLILAYLVTGNERYLRTASDGMGYLFGVNPCAKAFVTGTRRGFVHNPAHMASAAAPGDECMPGLVVCGPNDNLSDPYTKWMIRSELPPSLCYVDNMYSVSTNEPFLQYTAALIFISSFYYRIGSSALSGIKKRHIKNGVISLMNTELGEQIRSS